MQVFIIASMKQAKSLISYGLVLLWLTSVSTKLWAGNDIFLALRAMVKFLEV